MIDGDCIVCGDKTMKVVATSGHTVGYMSFIFPVVEGEEEHMACIFGGATAPWGNDEGKELQKESVLKYRKAAAEHHCDVALSKHTAFDNGIERITYSQSRLAYLPNIYILGEEGVQKFCEVYLSVLA